MEEKKPYGGKTPHLKCRFCGWITYMGYGIYRKRGWMRKEEAFERLRAHVTTAHRKECEAYEALELGLIDEVI